MNIPDILITGAGLAGLNCAKNLATTNQKLKIQILEKSKGCGGRMATRRIGDSKFDHGAQFIKVTQESKKLVTFWQEKNVANHFPSQAFEAICGQSGMTHLAKKIAENCIIKYNSKVIRLEKHSMYWRVFVEPDEQILAKQVVLTCPLPQSLDVLLQSEIDFDLRLSKIQYNQSIVLLVQFDSSLDSEMNYRENIDENIFSICSQRAKKLSQFHDYTIVMQNLWSHKYFEKSDDEISLVVKDLFQIVFPKKYILSLTVKKWRFASPAQIWERLYEKIAPGLYLAGDAFGGPSLIGALRSSDTLSEHLKCTD
jgi:predicted NAD/FAD-dependent oxidoreductase